MYGKLPHLPNRMSIKLTRKSQSTYFIYKNPCSALQLIRKANQSTATGSNYLDCRGNRNQMVPNAADRQTAYLVDRSLPPKRS